MAEWTGNLTIFYSNRPIHELARDLVSCFRESFGYQVELDPLGNGLGFLFYRDKQMLDHHLEAGFNVDREGCGCVGVEVDEVDFDARLSLFEFEGESDFEPYEVSMMLSGVLHITLVLPASADDNAFCSKVLRDIGKLTKAPAGATRRNFIREHFEEIKAHSMT